MLRILEWQSMQDVCHDRYDWNVFLPPIQFSLVTEFWQSLYLHTLENYQTRWLVT